ncbi:MAG: carboxypeptidase regulatory-like domain-containing protein [Gemmatimonadota bacterium]
MKNRTILLLIAVLITPQVAQSQIVRGIVIEDSARNPISNVNVELLTPSGNMTFSEQTNAAGVFVLRPKAGGRFTIRLTHPSYTAVTTDTVSVAAGEAVAIELRMARAAIPIEPLIVTARSRARLVDFYERVKQPGFGRFMTREEIEKLVSDRATDVVRGFAGVEVATVGNASNTELARPGFGRPSEFAPRVSTITMAGPQGRCLPTIFVDGMQVRQLADAGVDEFLKLDMLEGVEVYTGAAGVPSQLDTGNSCGVVAFWSRSAAAEDAFSWKRLRRFAGLLALMSLTAVLID